MPFKLYVSPAEGMPQWWHIADSDGVSMSGAFHWAEKEMPGDEARCDGYYLDGRESQSKHWRGATDDEGAAALYSTINSVLVNND